MRKILALLLVAMLALLPMACHHHHHHHKSGSGLKGSVYTPKKHQPAHNRPGTLRPIR